MASLNDPHQCFGARTAVDDLYDLGEEFFRWPLRSAGRGGQQDRDAKADRRVRKERGALPEEIPIFTGDGIKLFTDEKNAAALAKLVSGTPMLRRYLEAHRALSVARERRTASTGRQSPARRKARLGELAAAAAEAFRSGDTALPTSGWSRSRMPAWGQLPSRCGWSFMIMTAGARSTAADVTGSKMPRSPRRALMRWLFQCAR
jgi:hypothetical protein